MYHSFLIHSSADGHLVHMVVYVSQRCSLNFIPPSPSLARSAGLISTPLSLFPSFLFLLIILRSAFIGLHLTAHSRHFRFKQ